MQGNPIDLLNKIGWNEIVSQFLLETGS
jgi:hypothetical protein